MFQAYGSLSQWNYFRLETGILDNLMRQGNGSYDIIVLNFSKILFTFAIFFDIFSIFFFCPFLSLTTITGQRNFSSLGDGLLDRTFETKMVLIFFIAKLKTF